MIKLREIVNELNGIPKPNRRRAEVLVKLVYLQGKEDQARHYRYKIKQYERMIKKSKIL